MSAPAFSSPIPALPKLTDTSAPEWLRAAIARLPEAPAGWHGRGIVICGGGVRYFLCAWVCINMLRKQGCDLPVELWHLNGGEMNDTMRSLVEPLGVTCVNAQEVRELHPVRTLNGWELKPFALLHSAFREVFLPDADNLPMVDPSFLFETVLRWRGTSLGRQGLGGLLSRAAAGGHAIGIRYIQTEFAQAACKRCS